jgi:hypothetical protein
MHRNDIVVSGNVIEHVRIYPLLTAIDTVAIGVKEGPAARGGR